MGTSIRLADQTRIGKDVALLLALLTRDEVVLVAAQTTAKLNMHV